MSSRRNLASERISCVSFNFSETPCVISSRISSSVSLTLASSAVASPTAGSASIARIFASGYLCVSLRTIPAAREVFPTPPFPVTAITFAFPSIALSFFFSWHSVTCSSGAASASHPLHRRLSSDRRSCNSSAFPAKYGSAPP